MSHPLQGQGGGQAETLFQGRHYFVRSRESLDVLVASHGAADALELLVFDAKHAVEANRVYLRAVLVAGAVDHAALQSKVEAHRETLLRQKKSSSTLLFNTAAQTKALLGEAMARFALQRLQVERDGETALRVVFSSLAESERERERDAAMLLVEPPPGLRPVPCPFAAQRSPSDVRAALLALQSEAELLRRSTRRAALAAKAVDGFQAMLEAQRRERARQRGNKTLSLPRQRWFWAVHRVLARLVVQRVRARLGLSLSDSLSLSLTRTAHEGAESSITLSEPAQDAALCGERGEKGALCERVVRKTFSRRTLDNSDFSCVSAMSDSSLSTHSTNYAAPLSQATHCVTTDSAAVSAAPLASVSVSLSVCESVALDPQSVASANKTLPLPAVIVTKTETKRRPRGATVRTQRRSYDALTQLHPTPRQLPLPLLSDNPRRESLLATRSLDERAPTLLQSYLAISQRVQPEVSCSLAAISSIATFSAKHNQPLVSGRRA